MLHITGSKVHRGRPAWQARLPRSAGERPAASPELNAKNQDSNQDGEALRCRYCGFAITTPASAIEVGGRHLHTFFNPAGLIFEIGCFRHAPGCFRQGQPTGEFSWFSDHTWQMSLCAACSTHLGWFFLGPTGSFHGLIRNRLR